MQLREVCVFRKCSFSELVKISSTRVLRLLWKEQLLSSKNVVSSLMVVTMFQSVETQIEQLCSMIDHILVFLLLSFETTMCLICWIKFLRMTRGFLSLKCHNKP